MVLELRNSAEGWEKMKGSENEWSEWSASRLKRPAPGASSRRERAWSQSKALGINPRHQSTSSHSYGRVSLASESGSTQGANVSRCHSGHSHLCRQRGCSPHTQGCSTHSSTLKAVAHTLEDGNHTLEDVNHTLEAVAHTREAVAHTLEAPAEECSPASPWSLEPPKALSCRKQL